MKQLLLVLLFLLCVHIQASAQISQIVGLGIMAARNAKTTRLAKQQEDIVKTSYQGHSLILKRTPTNKLPRKGGMEIASVEQFLAGRFNTMNGDNVNAVLSSELESTFKIELDLLFRYAS